MNFDINLILIPLFFLSGAIWLGYSISHKLTGKQTGRGSSGGRRTDDGSKGNSASIPWWLDYSRSLFPIIAIVVVIRSFIVEPYQIPSSSMLPTLEQGDFILVSKYHYGLRLPISNYEVITFSKPQRGDVMVFNFPLDERVRYIKRVIGLPGDMISYSNKTLKINGEAPREELINSYPEYKDLREYLNNQAHLIREYSFTYDEVQDSWQVPAGHYFVMGDNRDNSNDSRYWGFVPHSNLIGKAFLVWLHWESWGKLPSFERVGLIR